MNIAVYVWIIAWTAARVMPVWTLLGLLTIPLTVRAIGGAFHPDDPSRLAPAMAANVLCVLLTQAFMGSGYLLAYAF